ncbi:nuclear transport factor 2 family protein, partial [Myxococcota bacterium]|nr:nuclear transport factor 2 family protein [Myxococcota bacterium]
RSEEVAASADPVTVSGTAAAPNAGAAAPSLSAEDRASIFGLYARYRDAADSGDLETLLLLFDRDAHFEGPLEWWAQHVEEQRDLRLRRLGLREVRQHFEVGRSLVKEDHGPSNRLIPQALRLPMAHSIEGDGESAAMASYFTFQYVDDPMRMLAYGQYLDRLEKTNQEWKIAHRFVDIQWDGRDPI